jgi:pilus assembly protein Flp/PilA
MARFIRNVKQYLAKYITKKEEGAALIEYALLVALIAVVCVAGITSVGNSIKGSFETVATKLGPTTGS